MFFLHPTMNLLSPVYIPTNLTTTSHPTPGLNYLPRSSSKNLHSSCSCKSSPREEERSKTAPAPTTQLSRTNRSSGFPNGTSKMPWSMKYEKVKHPWIRLYYEMGQRNKETNKKQDAEISKQKNGLPMVPRPPATIMDCFQAQWFHVASGENSSNNEQPGV